MKVHYIAACSKQSLPKIRAFVEGELRSLKINEDTTGEIVLAVDEACANSIIHHHSCDDNAEIKLTISIKGKELWIELTDHGDPFPIDDYHPEDLRDIMKTGQKGGLGISLIKKIIDKIEVIPGKNDFTYRFIKYL